MDWNRIEKEISFHADNVTRKGNHSNNFSLNVPLRELSSPPSKHYGNSSNVEENSPSSYQSKSYSMSNPNNIADSKNIAMITTLSNEISDLRNLFKKQASKMNYIENSLKMNDENNDLNKKYTDELSQKFDDLQFSLNDSKSINHELTKQNDDLFIKVRKLESQLQSMDDVQYDVKSNYTTKETFTKYLDTTIDQFQSLATVTDVARNKSTQAITLFESLLTALFSLNNNNSANNSTGTNGNGTYTSGANFKLDFLSILTAANSTANMTNNDNTLYKEQLTRLLTDSIQNTIATATKEHLTETLKVLNSNISTMIADLYSKQELSYKQLNDKYNQFTQENCDLLADTKQLVETHALYHPTTGMNDDRYNSGTGTDKPISLPDLYAEHKKLADTIKQLETDTKYLRENQIMQRSLTDELLTSQKTFQNTTNTVTSTLTEQCAENKQITQQTQQKVSDLQTVLNTLAQTQTDNTTQFNQHIELLTHNTAANSNAIADRLTSLLLNNSEYTQLKQACGNTAVQLEAVGKQCSGVEHEVKQMQSKLNTCCETVSVVLSIVMYYLVWFALCCVL